jgi:hypothetical protein
MAAAEQGIETSGHQHGGAQLRGIREIASAGAKDVGVRARSKCFLRSCDDMTGAVLEEKRMKLTVLIALDEVPIIGEKISQIRLFEIFSVEDGGLMKQGPA